MTLDALTEQVNVEPEQNSRLDIIGCIRNEADQIEEGRRDMLAHPHRRAYRGKLGGYLRTYLTNGPSPAEMRAMADKLAAMSDEEFAQAVGEVELTITLHIDGFGALDFDQIVYIDGQGDGNPPLDVFRDLGDGPDFRRVAYVEPAR